jgi:hypothetical protein
MIPIRLRLHPEPHTMEWASVHCQQLAGAFFDEAVANLAGTKTDTTGLLPTERLPAGFIFHSSRCGSSVLVNALGCIHGVAVIAEAQPVGEAITHGDQAMLRAVIGAMADVEGASWYVVKFRSGDTLHLAAIMAAFPKVPWVMQCRNPVEVMVSNLKHPTGWLAYKRRKNARMTDEHYCAATLGHFYNRAAAAMETGSGRVLDYSELNLANVLDIAKYFGFAPDTGERAAMAASLDHHSKDAGLRFTPDSSSKCDRASATVVEMAAKLADGPYRRLRGV